MFTVHIFLPLAALRFELSASQMLGRTLPIEPHLLPLFGFLFLFFSFDRVLGVFAWGQPQTTICLLLPHPQSCTNMSSLFANFLPGLALNCNPPDLYLLSSWDYMLEPLLPVQHLGF
jgi:hypothetical protein